MNATRHARTYRAVLHAYPRSFRRDYGEPMTQLFADRVRDVGAKAWVRVVPDLARSVPQQRIEAVMSKRPNSASVIVICVVVGVAAVIGAGGPGIIFVAAIALTALVLTQREFFASMFGGDRVPLRRAVTQAWWAPLAALVARSKSSPVSGTGFTPATGVAGCSAARSSSRSAARCSTRSRDARLPVPVPTASS